MLMTGHRVVSVLVAVIAVGSAFLVANRVAQAHSGDVIESGWASTAPTIDGVMTPGEWSNATQVDLGAIPGNRFPAFILAENDDTFLWIAYDVVGDVTQGTNDTAAFALDTDHDAYMTDGREDQFVMGGWISGTTAHYVYNASYYDWTVHDSPFNPALPNHAGLAGAWGFSPSDLGATDHRVFEFQVPLVLLGASAGDTLGFFGGSRLSPGVVDGTSGYDTWPTYVAGPISLSAYGDLDLATPPGPVGVRLSPSTAMKYAAPGTNVSYATVVRNTGTSGNDTFDITTASIWPVTLWDASGTVPLADTDTDGVPDTGNLTSGAFVGISVRVSVPGNASGCDVATVTATSSLNTSVLDTSSLTTCTAAAYFQPPHTDFGIDTDFPSNGYYNILEVDVVVYATLYDFYQVRGALLDGTGGTQIDSDWNYNSGGPGILIFALQFDGSTIYRSGFDGPYRVDLELYDRSGYLIDTDTHMTQAYNYTDFEPPGAMFRPPHWDHGIDTDTPPNGLFDFLALDVNLTVNIGGYYSIYTDVYTDLGNYTASGYLSSYLDIGARTVRITYRGPDLFRSGRDGPYRIELRLYDDYGRFMDNNTHFTRAYRLTEFEPPPIRFTPPHSDHGVDTDVPPDGFFDFLVVSVSLTVAKAANYTVEGRLYGPGGYPWITSASVEAYYTVGPVTVDLCFSGPDILRSGEDGPYIVYLRAYGPSTNDTVYDTYTTGTYAAQQFQPPAALFSPPHSDRGIDASVPPDGKYDWLEILASVNVTRARGFWVDAEVYDPYGFPVAHVVNSAALPVGLGVIPLLVDGHNIEMRGLTTSYLVYMTLYDDQNVSLDTDYYSTRIYSYAEFQPPDASAPSSSASVAGPYTKSHAPISIAFTASDAAPSDGIASVTLYYRYSLDNVTWVLPWVAFESKGGVRGESSLAGTFYFDLPMGEGYYQFYTVASDFAGHSEAPPAAADATAAVFVPARLNLDPASSVQVAGANGTFEVRVVNKAGVSVILESPLTVSLLATSSTGVFREVGSDSPITSITIPAGGSSARFNYADTRAGNATLMVVASAVAPSSASIRVTPGAAARIELSAGGGPLVIGSEVTITATVLDAYGNTIPDAVVTWTVDGPATMSSVAGNTVTVKATGDGTVYVKADFNVLSKTATFTVAPAVTVVSEGTSPVVVGIGGVIGGLLAGIAIGWVLWRWRKRPTSTPSSPAETPQPPASEEPGAEEALK